MNLCLQRWEAHAWKPPGQSQRFHGAEEPCGGQGIHCVSLGNGPGPPAPSLHGPHECSHPSTGSPGHSQDKVTPSEQGEMQQGTREMAGLEATAVLTAELV